MKDGIPVGPSPHGETLTRVGSLEGALTAAPFSNDGGAVSRKGKRWTTALDTWRIFSPHSMCFTLRGSKFKSLLTSSW
jgi:hypothetical protein